VRTRLQFQFFAPTTSWTSSSAIFFLLTTSGLAILGLVFVAALWAGTESDAAALDRQRKLVNSRLQDQVERVSNEIQLMGAGYASFLGVEPMSGKNSHHAAHIQGNAQSADTFGKVATTIFGYNAAFLVTLDGQLAFEAEAEIARRFKWIRPLLQPLIRKVQADEGGKAGVVGLNKQHVDLLRLEGRPSIAGVASVATPRDADGDGWKHGQLYLVAFRFLDGAALDTLSREQGLNGARYARTADQEENEVAFQIEATATGEPIGFIIWTPDLPGSRVIGRLVPVLSVAGMIIAGLFLALMARLRRTLRELSASENHARHLALHDVLTGLPNRALFAVRLEQCLARLQLCGFKAATAVIDLDKFKEVNDVYGHPAGDELLRAAADRMQALIRPGDMLARVGGDEFIILFADLSVSEHRHLTVCDDLIQALSQPFALSHGDALVRVGCSIGITTFSASNDSANEILRRADVALYDAKSKGRARFIEYDMSLDDRVEMRESLKSDLRILLNEADSGSSQVVIDRQSVAGWLEIFFQGVHSAGSSGTMNGAEALVRWRHPVLGLLSPDRFIPLAEEVGVIHQLGNWVLRKAASAAMTWPDHMSVAVNVSPSQIRNKDFAHTVMSILAETGLNPSRVELELTEAALFDFDEAAQETLALLRSKGIRIALDDFGTGFSSLSHLIQFNIDRIKIDRSFVRLLGTRAEGAAIVSAIINLSRTLGKATTAEGVETESQREFLAAAGCTDLQGFLLSKPTPSNDFSTRISSNDISQLPHIQTSFYG
jgi:diguanylate cyclase (GGDEF)-like protein